MNKERFNVQRFIRTALLTLTTVGVMAACAPSERGSGQEQRAQQLELAHKKLDSLKSAYIEQAKNNPLIRWEKQNVDIRFTYSDPLHTGGSMAVIDYLTKNVMHKTTLHSVSRSSTYKKNDTIERMTFTLPVTLPNSGEEHVVEKTIDVPREIRTYTQTLYKYKPLCLPVHGDSIVLQSDTDSKQIVITGLSPLELSQLSKEMDDPSSDELIERIQGLHNHYDSLWMAEGFAERAFVEDKGIQIYPESGRGYKSSFGALRIDLYSDSTPSATFIDLLAYVGDNCSYDNTGDLLGPGSQTGGVAELVYVYEDGEPIRHTATANTQELYRDLYRMATEKVCNDAWRVTQNKLKQENLKKDSVSNREVSLQEFVEEF